MITGTMLVIFLMFLPRFIIDGTLVKWLIEIRAADGTIGGHRSVILFALASPKLELDLRQNFGVCRASDCRHDVHACSAEQVHMLYYRKYKFHSFA